MQEIRLISQTKSRLRFQCPLFKGTNTEAIQKELSKLAGINSVQINSVTGSVIVLCDSEKFHLEEFKQTLSSLVQNFQPSESVSQVTRAKRDAQFTFKKKPSLKRKFRKLENRSMAVFGTACLAGVLAKSWHLHSWAGWFFAIASIAHTYRYRKNVW